MRILFRKPSNQPLELMEIENELEPIQKLIGGYIEVIYIRPDILCICDEDGLGKGLAQNYFNDTFGMIVGNVIFCGVANGEDGSDFASLTDEQIEFTIKYIGFPVVQRLS